MNSIPRNLLVGREMPSRPRGQVCKGTALTTRTRGSGNYEQDIYSTCMISRLWFFVASRTIVCQVPLSMGLSRQEHWSRLLFPQGSHSWVLCLLRGRQILHHWAIGEQFSKQDISCYKFCRGHSAVSSVRAGKGPYLRGFGKSLELTGRQQRPLSKTANTVELDF